MNFEVGTKFGDYEVVGILGVGGMGMVYKVRNVISDRLEAMKVLLPNLANEPDLAERFLREIKVQAGLDHPNIAALHTAIRYENQLLMFMELVEGETIDERLQKGAIPVAEAVSYTGQVLSALDYAHKRGIVHRDIKPANMMLTPSGSIKLMDFGIAKANTERKLTQTGSTLGSLYYMSPEQIEGKDVDARSDLYSVGVSLYEMVTGKKPFEGDSQYAVMAAHLADRPPIPPVTVDPNLPPALSDMIMLAVTRDLDGRFQTAAAFLNALRSIEGEVGRPAAAAAPAATPAPVAAPLPAAGVVTSPTLDRPSATVIQTPPPAAAPPPAAQQDFHLIQPTPPEKPGGHRGLWVAIGAVCTAAVVIGVVQFGPWKRTHANDAAKPAPQAVTAPAPAPAVPAAPAAPAPQATPPADVIPDVKSVLAPERPKAQPAAKAVAQQPVSRPAAAQAPAARPVNAPPAEQAQQAPPPSTPPPPRQTQPPVPAMPSRAELQQAREQLALLGARASTVRSSLAGIERSQAASGLSMRADWKEAATLMGTFLDGANAALNAGDLGSAKDFLEKAERQIERLEKALGR